MATPKSQRIGILIILIVLVIGTLGLYIAMVLAPQNSAKDDQKKQAITQQYMAEQQEYQKKIQAQADQLSSQYYATFAPYKDQVGTFDRDSVSSVSTEDLVVGSGEEVTGTTAFAAYYIGWDANGNVFDESIDTTANKLKAPLYDSVGLSQGLDKASLIEGWKEGMKGMHIGGIRVITIPSDKAYGEKGNSTIAPNMPIKFVVMAIPAPESIPQPDMTKYYEALQNLQ